MGVTDAPPISPVTPWLPSADGIDPILHLDFIGQNYRSRKTQRTLAQAILDIGGYFSRPSVAYWFNALSKLTLNGAEVPHQSWSPVTSANRGLKIERASTNQVANSATAGFTAGTNATAAVSPVNGPDGTRSLQRITGSANGGYMQSGNVATFGANTGNYTASAIIPKGSSSQAVRLSCITSGGTGGNYFVDFDLLTGVVNSGNGGSGGAYGVDDLGSFWLAWYTMTLTTDTTIQGRFYPGSTAATGTADVGWFQIEQGTGPTSRIVTTGTAGVRRERDHLSIPVASAFGAATSGTLSVSATPALVGIVERVIAQIDDGTENNSIRIRRSTSGNIEVVWTSAGSIISTMNLGTHVLGTSFTVTVGWDTTTSKIKAIRDGGSLTTASLAPPPGLSTIRAGANTTTSSLDGYITALSTWKGLRTESFYTAPVGTIVALGDSMAAGSGASVSANQWNYLLTTALKRTLVLMGYPGVSSATVLANWLSNVPSHFDKLPIIFCGHNFTQTTDPVSDIAAMIAQLTTDPRRRRFLVVSPLQSSANATNSSGFLAIAALRAPLKAAYPNNYVDLYAYLATKGDGGATDNADIAAGYTPTSLRADSIHLNDAGQAHEATLYQAELTKRGW